MSVLTHFFPKVSFRHGEQKRRSGISINAKSLSEAFWFTTALGLFIVMGPFSIVAAVIGVFSFLPEQNSGQEPEALAK